MKIERNKALFIGLVPKLTEVNFKFLMESEVVNIFT